VTPPQEDICPEQGLDQTSTDWLEPLPSEVKTRHRRFKYVSRDQRYDQATTVGDLECTEATTRIPVWILPLETHETLFREGHGTSPDLIYAIGVPDTPSPDPSTLDCKKCNLILIEVIGFCQEFGCHKRLQEKTAKYAPLVTALKAVWGKVKFVAVPIRHKTRDWAKTSYKRSARPRDRLRREDPRLLPLQDPDASTHKACSD